MKVYIAGPMRGYKDFNYPAFHEAAKYLREIGLEVFNPAETPDQAMSFAQYMAIDLPEVCKADTLVLLPGWQDSCGAVLEYTVARALGKDCVTYAPSQECGARINEFRSSKEDEPEFKKDPAAVAYAVINEIVAEGLKKHKADSWRVEPQDNHLDKAARHILTYKLIRDGNSPPDGEHHLKNALCRLAMAYAQ